MTDLNVQYTSAGLYRVSVERYDLRNDWYEVVGENHRTWVISCSPIILAWLHENVDIFDMKIIEDFIHDDYLCFYHFVFTKKQDAELFLTYLKQEWCKP